MINKACPTPATTGTMETPRANGDAGAEQLLEAPVDEMDYINSSCCSSSWSLNITVTVLTPFRKKSCNTPQNHRFVIQQLERFRHQGLDEELHRDITAVNAENISNVIIAEK